ncbi:uncharacterized protein LOC131931786 [Physella acuta]|uniref:uncharacterized protein LOC131931786 n=1 Tax=Physella acuta TaxID=109671 RepID=UPI0027DC89D6|nr:uncharacterized protein LOC131931786 [Physella acuta]
MRYKSYVPRYVTLLSKNLGIVDADVVTIAFDATTISGKHINEVHFGTPENVFTANITELAGGRAEDYAGHVLNTIEDLATTYSSFCEVDKEETKLQMCGKVSSTLTDRASANHAAVLLLNEKLQTNLLELNCHLHPLDGIANEVRKTFQKFNSLIPSDTFGSDCRAANLLYGISKLRYKAKGDPTGFKAFLRQHSLACGIFPRYVGNRLHVMFCLAGIVYRHRHLLVLYLEKYCSNISLRAALLKDLKNDIIISQLQALGLWGKYLTGAWMSVFYAKESKRNHFDMVEYQKVAMKFIARVIAEPEYLLIGCEDAFGRPLIADETLSSLLIVDDTNLEAFSTATEAMATATQAVLSRQLSRYLEGDLAAPTEAMLAAAASAPVHNIWAERALGVVDSLSRRAPNSEITFLDAKTKVKLNKSLDWLSSKPAAVQQQIIQFCIKRGAVCRKLGKDRRLEKERELQRRLMEKKPEKRHGKPKQNC